MTTPEEALGRSYDPELMRRMLAYLRTRRGLGPIDADEPDERWSARS